MSAPSREDLYHGITDMAKGPLFQVMCFIGYHGYLDVEMAARATHLTQQAVKEAHVLALTLGLVEDSMNGWEA